jgi:hypothetical protein
MIDDPRHYEHVKAQAIVAISECWEDCLRAYAGPGQPSRRVIFALIVSRLISYAHESDSLELEDIRDVVKNELDALDFEIDRRATGG